MNDNSLENWLADKRENEWEMPRAAWWKRLPVIRHFRAAIHRFRVAENEWFWGQIGMTPGGYDRWVLYGIAKGFERPLSDEKASGS